MTQGTFGERLRDLRKRRKLSQIDAAADLADLGLRMSQTTLSALEQQTEMPRAKVVKVIAGYFDVSIDYFKPLDTQRIESAIAYLEVIRDGGVVFPPFIWEGDEMPHSIRHMRLLEGACDEDEFFDT